MRKQTVCLHFGNAYIFGILHFTTPLKSEKAATNRGSKITNNQHQTVSLALPLALLLEITFLPPALLILALKP